MSDEVIDLDGLQVMIQSLTSPTDGPIGDSSLWLSDGTTILLNQNDARPSDLTSFAELGQVDVHLLQFSGAIWFPMVYDLPKRAKQALGATKRERQFDRTLRYIEDLKARLRDADRRAAVLPRRRALGLQRHLRRRVEHLPRSAGVPGLDGGARSPQRPAAAARHRGRGRPSRVPGDASDR